MTVYLSRLTLVSTWNVVNLASLAGENRPIEVHVILGLVGGFARMLICRYFLSYGIIIFSKFIIVTIPLLNIRREKKVNYTIG